MNELNKWKTVEELILACCSEQKTTAKEVKDAIQDLGKLTCAILWVCV